MKAILSGLVTPARAEIPEYDKTWAVITIVRKNCPMLKVNAPVAITWLRSQGFARRPLTEGEVRTINLLIGVYEKVPDMGCEGIYRNFGPTGAIVNGMVEATP